MRTVPITTVLAMLALAGCSSPPPVEQQPGTLVLGTAQVTVADADGGTTDAVACTTAGSLITITTGDADSGIHALVSNDPELAAQWVNIRNVAGFSGSFQANLQGDAEVTQTGRTYSITGTADGFRSDDVLRTSSPFTVKVAC